MQWHKNELARLIISVHLPIGCLKSFYIDQLSNGKKDRPWIDWKVRALFLCFWPYSGLRTTWQTWQTWQNDQNHLALTWHVQWSLSTARTSGNSKAEWSTIQEWVLYQETIDHSESDFFILWWVQTDQNMIKTLYPKPQNGSKFGEVGKLAKIDSCLVQF